MCVLLVGATSRNSTILIPHSPGGVNGVIDQLRDAVMVGNVVGDTES